METRGETSEVNDYMKEQVRHIVSGAAQMYQTDYQIDIVGEVINYKCSTDLANELAQVATTNRFIEHVDVTSEASAGSEDATYF